MSSGPRKNQSWPFARGSPQDSVGEFRGTLRVSLVLVGGLWCWEAKGDARKAFESGLRVTIIDFLKKHSDKARESGSYLSVALLMVGRRPEQTKPTVMFVSDDKAARKEAFNLIKGSDIMTKYPGFEVGHTDFEKLMALGGDAFEIFSMPHPVHDLTVPRYLFHFPPEGSGLPVRKATAGGIISHRGKYMYLTVSHFLDDPATAVLVDPNTMEDAAQDTDSDCEVTGLDNLDDDDTDFLDSTSQGSISGVDDDDVSANFSRESSDSTELSTGPPASLERSTSGRSELDFDSQAAPTGETTAPSILSKSNCTLAGQFVLRSKELDYALVEANDVEAKEAERRGMVVSLDDLLNIESAPRETTVIVTAPDGRAIHGTLSGTTHDVRLPGSDEFAAVYSARFNQPLWPGDCGNWVRDAETGAIFGHVFAGSPTSGLAVVMPASTVFRHAKALLGWLSEQFPAKALSGTASSSGQKIPSGELSTGDQGDIQDRLVQLDTLIAHKRAEIERLEEIRAETLKAGIWGLESLVDHFLDDNVPEPDSWGSSSTLFSDFEPTVEPSALETAKVLQGTIGDPMEDWGSLESMAKELLARQTANTEETRTLPSKTPYPQDSASGDGDGTTTKGGDGVRIIPKAKYERPKHSKVHCSQCHENPDGFRGEHELRRHIEAKHATTVKKWICRDPATAGISSNVEAVKPLSSCKHCTGGKVYGAYYNAAAHLRRTHFRTKPNGRKHPSPAIARGDWPAMSDLKEWMVEITVPRDILTANEPSADVNSDTISDPEHDTFPDYEDYDSWHRSSDLGQSILQPAFYDAGKVGTAHGQIWGLPASPEQVSRSIDGVLRLPSRQQTFSTLASESTRSESKRSSTATLVADDFQTLTFQKPMALSAEPNAGQTDEAVGLNA